MTGDGADVQLQLFRLLGDEGAATGGPAGNVFDKLERKHMLGSSTRRVYEMCLLSKKFGCILLVMLAFFSLAIFGLLHFRLREYAPLSYRLFLIVVGGAHCGTTIQIFLCTCFLQSRELSKALDHCKESVEGPVEYENLKVHSSYFYEPKFRVFTGHCVLLFLWVVGFALTLEPDARFWHWSQSTWFIVILAVTSFHFGNNGPRYVQALTVHISRKLLSQFEERVKSASDGSSEKPLWQHLREEYSVMTSTLHGLWNAVSGFYLSRMLTVSAVSTGSAIASGIAALNKYHGTSIAYGLICLWNGAVSIRLIYTADLPNILLVGDERDPDGVDFAGAGYSTQLDERADNERFVAFMGRHPPRAHLFQRTFEPVSILFSLLLFVLQVLFHFACFYFQLDEAHPFVAFVKDLVEKVS